MSVATFKTLDDLKDELAEMGNHSPEYWAKQVHTVEPSKVIDREDFLVKLCTGKTVLHVGCTGALDAALRKVATKCYGIDKEWQPSRADFACMDFDSFGGSGLEMHTNGDFPPHWAFPVKAQFADVELIVCGEVLEHLSNPGVFLDAMRRSYPTQPVAFTVPNAFCEVGVNWLLNRHRENVHKDHVCYYSVTTLTTLLKRAGYERTRHYWYKGKPYVSEGIVLLARPIKG